MLCEISYKVGDGGSWKDGQPVEVRPSGVFVTEAEFTSWLSGSEPSSIATLRPQKAAKMRRFVQRMKTLIDPNIDIEAVAAASLITTADAEAHRVDALAIRQKIATFGGVDSTWGFEELRKMSVMIVDLSLEEIEEATSIVETLPEGEIIPRLTSRRPKIVDYRSLLSADSIDTITNPDTLVVPARGEVPFTFDVLLTDA